MVDDLSNALTSDFSNGTAKRFFSQLILFIRGIASIAPGSMRPIQTASSDRLNSNVEIYVDESHLNLAGRKRRRTSSSSSSSTAFKGNTSKVVPDGCVGLSDKPGRYALVYEMKSANDLGNGKQNLKQMLSKMFFQDIIFGLTCSPLAYMIQVILKRKEVDPKTKEPMNKLEILLSDPIPLSRVPPESDERLLVIENVNTLVLFLYNVMRWSDKNRCMLYT